MSHAGEQIRLDILTKITEKKICDKIFLISKINMKRSCFKWMTPELPQYRVHEANLLYVKLKIFKIQSFY